MRWWNQCPCPGVACTTMLNHGYKSLRLGAQSPLPMSIEWQSGPHRQLFISNLFHPIQDDVWPWVPQQQQQCFTTNTALNCRSDDKSNLPFLLPTSNEEQWFLLPTSHSELQQQQVELKPKETQTQLDIKAQTWSEFETYLFLRSDYTCRPSIPWAKNSTPTLSTRPWLSSASTVGIRTLTQFTLIWIWFIFTFEIDM